MPERINKMVSGSDGFTLIEILVSTLIVSMIMVVLISVYLTAYRGYDRGRTINLIQEEGNRIINVFSRNVYASTEAAMDGSDLVLTLDEDTLEYQENGECEMVTFSHVPSVGMANGSIVQTFTGCDTAIIASGTYQNVISNEGTETAVNVTNFGATVTTEDSGRTYLVGLQFVLGQSLNVDNRGNYQTLVPFETKISTRGYIN